jgi:hypothetical protein
LTFVLPESLTFFALKPCFAFGEASSLFSESLFEFRLLGQ